LYGIAEGPKELQGQNIFNVLDLHSISFKKLNTRYSNWKTNEEEKVLVSFFVLDKNLEEDIEGAEVFKLYQNINEHFNDNLVSEELRGDDKIVLGKVIAQKYNVGIALVDIKKFNKSFYSIKIKGKEAIVWKKEYDKEKEDKDIKDLLNKSKMYKEQFKNEINSKLKK